MLVRPAMPQDLPAVQSIYAHHVLHGLASFEEVPPPVEEMQRRYADVMRQGLPYLVAEENGEILGYGYCTLYRTRSAYRYTLEDSIYVKDGRQGKGVGRAVLSELIRICTGLDYRQIIAVIGDSANAASIRLHASLGFVRAGLLRSSGFKFGRWVDSVYMQLPLGAGDGTRP
ncbi:MAG TPA: GNAT family N-acetyltransferase [Burkholderiales bacterium]|nr:GNAT family N-acetyltransferase [Burkholderiales bacterium]